MPKKLKILLILWFFCLPGLGQAAENIAYQLAQIQTRSADAGQAFLKGSVTPDQAMVSEFQWLLDSMLNRCLNPAEAIASTMVQTWKALQQKQPQVTLLEVSRELCRIAKNTKIFGTNKVNFRMTSQFWLESKLSGYSIETIIKGHIINNQNK